MGACLSRLLREMKLMILHPRVTPNILALLVVSANYRSCGLLKFRFLFLLTFFDILRFVVGRGGAWDRPTISLLMCTVETETRQ